MTDADLNTKIAVLETKLVTVNDRLGEVLDQLRSLNTCVRSAELAMATLSSASIAEHNLARDNNARSMGIIAILLEVSHTIYDLLHR